MGALLKLGGQFRIYLVYDIFSALGNGVFILFMLLSVHLIFGNALYTGIAGFLMSAPRIFSFAIGPVVDRSKKVTIMRLTTLTELVMMALLTFTPMSDDFGVVFMFAVILVFAIAQMIGTPTGNALLPHIVKDDEILQANSLINIVSTVAGLILAFILFTVLEQGDNWQLIFGISMSFLAVAFLFSLFLRELNEKTEVSANALRNYLADIMAGMKFLRRNVLLFFIAADIALAFFGQISYVNRPAFFEYHVGARGYIILSVVLMVGSLIASFLVVPLSKKFKVSLLLAALYLFAGASRIVFALVLPISFIAAIAITIVNALFLASLGMVEGTLSQKIPPKDMVGRVDAMKTSFVAISVALGALAGGIIGQVVSDVAHIFLAQGAIVLVASLYYILVPSIRRLPKIDDIVRDGENPGEENDVQSE